MTSRSIACASLLEGPGYDIRGPRRIGLDGGRIGAIEEAQADGGGEALFALPALVNAHDHGRPVRSSSFGAAGKPLELWLQYLALLPAVDPYLAAASSLGRSVLGGAGAVMVHHTRVQGLTSFPEEAADVRMTALMMWGSTGIPALLMAMTQGELWAPLALSSVSAGSLLETVTPIMKDPRT